MCLRLLYKQRVSFREGLSSPARGDKEASTRPLASSLASGALTADAASLHAHVQALEERVALLQSQLETAQRQSAEREVVLRSSENEMLRLRIQLASEQQRAKALEEEVSALTAAQRTCSAEASRLQEELRQTQRATASAQEMWLKESARASKLADELDSASSISLGLNARTRLAGR